MGLLCVLVRRYVLAAVLHLEYRGLGMAASWTCGPGEVAMLKAQGIEVKDRGRVPAELVVKFKAATGQ